VSARFFDLQDQAEFSPQKLQKVALCESERLLFDLYCLEPGQAQKVHAHDNIDKIYVVMSGAPTVQLGDEARPLAVGQAAYAPAGVPHGVRNDTAARATLLVFQARGPAKGQGQ
jgi:mannose-6-phosphate isomerase-like protein (cupin superfamily)